MVSGTYQEDLAYIHDAGFGDVARAAAPHLIRTLSARGLTEGTIVELGCGSGIVLSALAAAGYAVIGIDSSGEMLRLARAKAPAAELRCQSLYEAAIPPCSALVATGEPLNYETVEQNSVQKLPSLFGRIFTALRPGGIFLFDALFELPETATQYQTWRAGEDWAALIEVSHEKPGLLSRRIIAFREGENGYRRSEERHPVRLFSLEDVKAVLIDSGFSVQIRPGYGQTRLPPGRRLFEAYKP